MELSFAMAKLPREKRIRLWEITRLTYQNNKDLYPGFYGKSSREKTQKFLTLNKVD